MRKKWSRKCCRSPARRRSSRFPVSGGILGWQRKKRYEKRCDLFLYDKEQLAKMFAKFPGVKATIEPISRDFFVTLEKTGKAV